jgi:hypothetical protein
MAYSGTLPPLLVVLGDEGDETDDLPQLKRKCLHLEFVISYIW